LHPFEAPWRTEPSQPGRVHSHCDTPIPDRCTIYSNSNAWGEASERGKTQAIDAPMGAGGSAGLDRIEMIHVESGQIRLGQMDHGQLRVTEVDAHRAANTAPEQSAQTLSAADQQAQAHALEHDQNAHTHARSGPVLA
jgi:hypothetical protein